MVINFEDCVLLLKYFCGNQDSMMNLKSKQHHLFKTEVICNILNVFPFGFDQVNASLNE